MHICMVSAEFPPFCWGVGRHTYEVSKRLVQRGHKVTVLTRGSWKHQTIHFQQEGIQVYRVRFLPVYPFHVRLHGIFLRSIFKSLESGFDLVHYQNPLVPCLETKLPKVVTELSTSVVLIRNTAPTDIHSIFLRLFSRELIRLDAKILESADKILSVSRSCANGLRAICGVDDKKIIVLGNGVDPRHFMPKNEEGGGARYVLYTGRLDSVKGLTDLVKSAQYVLSQYPEVKYVLVGEGPLRNRLRRMIHTLQLDKDFLLPGFIDFGVLVQYYQRATVYVQPSYSEGLATSLLEAMACGSAIVATNIAANAELIKDGYSGLLVPPREPQKLAEATLKLLADKELRKRLGQNARKHVEDNYDWDIIVDRMEEVYASLLTGAVQGRNEAESRR